MFVFSVSYCQKLFFSILNSKNLIQCKTIAIKTSNILSFINYPNIYIIFSLNQEACSEINFKLSQPNVSSLTNRWGIHRILVSFRKWPKTLSWTYFTRVFLISVLCQTVFLIRSFLLFFQNDVAIFLSGSLWLGYSFSWQDHQDNLLIWVISSFAWFSMPKIFRNKLKIDTIILWVFDSTYITSINSN